MAAQSQLNLPPMPVQAFAPQRTNGGPSDGQGVVPEGTNGLSLLVASVAETCSEKEAAFALGLADQAYWSKVKAGEKPAPRIDRLTELPITTQRDMCARWSRQIGMHVTTEDARRRAVANLVKAAAEALAEIA